MTIDVKRFSEHIKNLTSGREVATDKTFDLSGNVSIAKKYVLVLELK